MKRQSNPIQSNPIQSNPILTAIAAAFLLAACSSGGSSHSHRPHSQVQNHTQNGGGSAVSGNTVVRDENKPLSDTLGYYLGFETKNNKAQFYSGKIGISDKPLEIVRINGQEIPLLPATAPQPHNDGHFNRWHDEEEGNPKNDGLRADISTHLQHARYGRLGKMPGLDNGKVYLFAQGNVSTSLPTTENNLTYRGRALVFNFAQKRKNIDATSEFTVNFADKKLSGKLLGAETVQFNADIQGSHFSSKDKSAVEVKGAFYGADAAELAGVFHDAKQSLGGAFGAKKQQ